MARSKVKPKSKRPVDSAQGGAARAATSSDPRLLPDFHAEYLPLCDGGIIPPADTTDRIERRQIEFLAVYYRLNRLYALLQAIRLGLTPGDDALVLREIQKAMRDRDALEDRYEPEGFLGEPVMDGVFYKDIEFTYAVRRQPEPLTSSHFSLFIPLPPPKGKVEDWIHEHLTKAFPELAIRSSPKVGSKRPRSAKQAGGRAKTTKAKRRIK
jgi:hypothetical protein